MTRNYPLRLRLVDLLPLAFVLVGLAVLAGWYPTRKAAGTPGLWAMGVAGGIVGAAMLLNAVAVVHFAQGGPRKAAYAFIMGGLVRVMIVAAVSAVAWKVYDVPIVPLLVWIGIFYILMLVAEMAWLARALKRDEHLAALGEIDRWDTAKKKNEDTSKEYENPHNIDRLQRLALANESKRGTSGVRQ